jgi:NAD(P)-dependent dehydrogenase (short-subunit alcohol dehydrogenase family)
MALMASKRVALVTGGTRGIGLGISRCLIKEGFDLAVCGIRDARAVAGVVKELGSDVLYCSADISDRAARRRLIDAVRKRFGRINVLVNNAGVAPEVRADILEASEESFDRLIGVNLRGPYFLTQAVARWMIEQKKAHKGFPACIVNVSSISAVVASPTRGDYCLSKAAVSMSTKLWAARLGEFDIPVYEVSPGLIETDMTAPVRKKYDALIRQGLLLQARWGRPEDVGKAVAMMVRGDIPYSTGQVVTVDGGLTLRRL